MSAHTCKTLTDGCYRCDLNRDEIEAARAEVLAEAHAAWVAYREAYARAHGLSRRNVAHKMRRRDFIAGYLAANEMSPEVTS